MARFGIVLLAIHLFATARLRAADCAGERIYPRRSIEHGGKSTQCVA